MKPRIWECMGVGQGQALVLAQDRQAAVRACLEWLGWKASVAFSAPEQEQLWRAGGGTESEPVVHTRDEGRTWTVVTMPAWRREQDECDATA